MGILVATRWGVDKGQPGHDEVLILFLYNVT